MFEIDPVAAAVSDLDDAVAAFRTATDAEYVWTHESDEWEYRPAYLLADDDMFTLIEPTSPESFIARFLDQRGPGLHHLGVNVEDLDAAVERTTAAGDEVVMTDTVAGVRDEATLHPRSWFGIQLQLIEWHDGIGASAREHIAALRAANEDDG